MNKRSRKVLEQSLLIGGIIVSKYPGGRVMNLGRPINKGQIVSEVMVIIYS